MYIVIRTEYRVCDMSKVSKIDQIHLRAVMLCMSKMLKMSKIHQIHLRAVMLCMSKMSKMGKEHTDTLLSYLS